MQRDIEARAKRDLQESKFTDYQEDQVYYYVGL